LSSSAAPIEYLRTGPTLRQQQPAFIKFDRRPQLPI
jgi:hypothetical protein